MINYRAIMTLVACLASPGVVHSASTCNPADFAAGAEQFTHRPIVGAVRARSAKVGFRTDKRACVQVKYATNPDLIGGVISDARLTRAVRDFTGKVVINKLTPNTTYYYTVVVNGLDTTFLSPPRFRIFPRSKDAASFTFGVLSDLKRNALAPAMAALAQGDPDFVVILGDYPHGSPETLSEMRVLHREAREEAVSAPDLRDNILRQFPVAHVWDDHD